MDMHTRNEYMKKLKERYCEADKKENRRIQPIRFDKTGAPQPTPGSNTW